MKAMFIVFAAIAVSAVGSNLILDQVGFFSQDHAAGSAARLDD